MGLIDKGSIHTGFIFVCASKRMAAVPRGQQDEGDVEGLVLLGHF